MRDVAATANVALATIYRYFSSKDHLLAAAMTEWTARLRGRVVQSPPKGETAADQLVDVLLRACRAMERQPKLTIALVRALSSSDSGVQQSGADVHAADRGDGQRASSPSSTSRSGPTSSRCSATSGTRRSVAWANGRRAVQLRRRRELERATRVLVEPYEAELRTSRADGHKR